MGSYQTTMILQLIAVLTSLYTAQSTGECVYIGTEGLMMIMSSVLYRLPVCDVWVGHQIGQL